MALLDDMRIVARVSGNATDSELQMWIAAALADMARAGVPASLLDEKTMNPLAKAAVATYVRANYGYDVEERDKFSASYTSILCDLVNSPSMAGGPVV